MLNIIQNNNKDAISLGEINGPTLKGRRKLLKEIAGALDCNRDH